MVPSCLSVFVATILKFQSVATSLVSRFDLYFSKRWFLLVPNTRVTQRGLSESHPLNWFQDFLHRVSLKLFLQASASESCDTQQHCDTLFTTVTAFLSSISLHVGSDFSWVLFGLFINLVMWNSRIVSSFTPGFIFVELTLGLMPIFKDFRVHVSSKQHPHGYRKMDPWLFLSRILLLLDTLPARAGSACVSAVCSGVCARSWASWRKLHLSPREN